MMNPDEIDTDNDKDKKKLKKCRNKLPYRVCPTFLLTNIYFLNNQCTNFVLVGCAPSEKFKPTIIIFLDDSFVELALSDWVALNISNELTHKWFKSDDIKEGLLIKTNNISIEKKIVCRNKVLQIQNLPQISSNNYIELKAEDFQKINEMNTFIQFLMKKLQSHWLVIQDYYNLYIYYCYIKNKNVLDDEDFFVYDEPKDFDSYRLFREISFLCKDKILLDNKK